MNNLNELEKKKIDLRIHNERYLASHPEIRIMLNRFCQEVLENKPEDLIGYTVQFFSQPSLKNVINK